MYPPILHANISFIWRHQAHQIGAAILVDQVIHVEARSTWCLRWLRLALTLWNRHSFFTLDLRVHQVHNLMLHLLSLRHFVFFLNSLPKIKYPRLSYSDPY